MRGENRPLRIDERKQKVLEAIIKDYVATAEPVGSRTIARKYGLGVSPATIRNEMADLEEMGLIEQPHTSAGRIPSQRGYRYYVDHLMEKYDLTESEKSSISNSFARKIREIDLTIQETGRLLSQLTNYTSIVMGPVPLQKVISRIEFIPLQVGKIMLILVSDTGMVMHKILDMPESIEENDLHRISQALNLRLQGVMFDNIKRTLLQELRSELMRQRQLLATVLEILDEYLRSGGEEKIYLGGILNILNQPEFRNIERIKKLIAVLEEEDFLRELLAEGEGEGVTVRIGDENRRQEFQDCSVVIANYEVGGRVVGRLGILGPTRMEYPRAVSVVEFVSRALSEVLGEFMGGRS